MDRTRPNIVLLHWHDLGTRLGAYGHSDVDSPAVDRLAAQGWRFDNAFATAPQCSPARGSLFTGRYPHANGLMGLAHTGWEYHPQEATLPMLLRRRGYRSALIGLQHESATAERTGFDEIDSPKPSYPAAELATRAGEWLSRRHDEPFLLTVGFTETHRPWPESDYPPADPAAMHVPAHLSDAPGTREDLAAFAGSIRVADRAVGEIVRALDESPHAANTWVVFTTDHGPAFPRAKGSLYDPGLRIALVIRPPGGDDATGGVIDRAVSQVDVVPTLLDLTGTPAPDNLHGTSVAPLLRGRRMVPQEVIYAEKTSHRGYDPMRCVRALGFKYIRNYEPRPRLVLPTDIETSLSRRDIGDDHLLPRPAEELYDLLTDPDERHDLADDPAHAVIRERLAQLLLRWRQETGDPLLDGPIAEPEPAPVASSVTQ